MQDFEKLDGPQLATILLDDRCRLLGRGSITPISYAFALSCSSTHLWGFTTLRMAWVAFYGASVSHWTDLYDQFSGNLDAVKGNLNGMSGTPLV